MYIIYIYYIDIPFVPPIMSLLTTAFVTSVHGVAKIVLICAAGAYLEKAGILHKESWCCEESDSTKKTDAIKIASCLIFFLLLNHFLKLWDCFNTLGF